MVNIRGLEEINGENFPLDIWSAYMQQAVKEYPKREFEKPGPGLDLDKGKPGEEPEETTGGEDTSPFPDFSQAAQPDGSRQSQGQPSSSPPPRSGDGGDPVEFPEGFPFND
jgi:penicillin-binding protein 1A